MINGGDILQYLLPDGGWAISGMDFDSIIYDDGIVPITKEQFEQAIPVVQEIEKNKQIETAAARAALLKRLGITAEEARLLLS